MLACASYEACNLIKLEIQDWINSGPSAPFKQLNLNST